MYCESCGSKLEDGARFCTACGAPVLTPSNQPTKPISTSNDPFNPSSYDPSQPMGNTANMPPQGYTNTQPQGYPSAQPQGYSNTPPAHKETNVGLIAGIAIAAVAIIALVVIVVLVLKPSSSTDTQQEAQSIQASSSVSNNENQGNATSQEQSSPSSSPSPNTQGNTTGSMTRSVSALSETGETVSGTVRVDNSGYVIPDSSTRRYSLSELRALNLSDAELCIAWNEPYARDGYSFKNSGLRSYFNGCPWYRSGSGSGEATAVGRSNSELLKQLANERANGYKWINLTTY